VFPAFAMRHKGLRFGWIARAGGQQHIGRAGRARA
jgi:hypothetical protein